MDLRCAERLTALIDEGPVLLPCHSLHVCTAHSYLWPLPSETGAAPAGLRLTSGQDERSAPQLAGSPAAAAGGGAEGWAPPRPHGPSPRPAYRHHRAHACPTPSPPRTYRARVRARRAGPRRHVTSPTRSPSPSRPVTSCSGLLPGHGRSLRRRPALTLSRAPPCAARFTVVHAHPRDEAGFRCAGLLLVLADRACFVPSSCGHLG